MDKSNQFSIDRFDNEPYINNPLLKFRLKDISKQKQNETMKHRAAMAKLRLCRREAQLRPTTTLQSENESKSDEWYVNVIREAVASAPIASIPSRMKRKISGFAPENLQRKYPNIVTEYMREVSDDYTETLKLCNLRRCLTSEIAGPDCVAPPKFRFKYLGRTKNYGRFCRNRKLLAKNLFLPYNFIRSIVSLSRQQFPAVLISMFDRQHTTAVWMTLSEFESMVQRNLEKNSIFLKEQWYPKIVRILQKSYRKRILPPTTWVRVLACATKLINRELTELKVDTFKYVLSMLGDRVRMPRIKFQAICNATGIDLHPSLHDVLSVYRNIFKMIANVATRLPALEHQIDRVAFQSESDFLKIEIGDVFMEQMLDDLGDAVSEAYVCIAEHIDRLKEKAVFLYSVEAKTRFTAFLDEPRQIDEYLAKIGEFQVFKVSLQKMVQNEYFGMALVNQSKAISGMRAVAQEFIDAVTDKMVNEHQKDSQRICDWFEEIKRRALEAPKSTERLLANGEFMLQVKNKKIAEIHEHIQSNFKVCAILVELTELKPAHSALLVTIVQWTKSIHEMFEQNASQFEIYKNQFEEHLGVVTRKLTQDINEMVPKLAIIDDMYETDRLRNYHATLDIYNERLLCFEDYIHWINKEEKLFKLPVSQYPILEEMKHYVTPFTALVKLCIDWLRYYYIWMDGPFDYLDPVAIETSVAKYMQEFEATQKYYRNRIKQDMLGNPVLKFRGQTEDPDPEKHPVPLRLCSRMIDWIKGFENGVYIVKIMCNSALRNRHWVEMSEIAGFDLMPDAGTSLRKITKFGIEHLLPNFEIISIGANKELQLQNDLYDMFREWRNVEFPFTAYKDTNIQILGNIEDIHVLLDDHTLKTLSMCGSAFVKPCEDEVRSWYDKLIRVSRTFDEWLKLQTNWLYLLPILSSDDIRVQMPDEGHLFDTVNGIYCKYIDMAIKQPIVMKMATTEGFLEALLRANQMLDEIKMGVKNYLERKRLFFPRFFFLSNDEMLRILSETKHPQNVQTNLSKCFEGIHRLQLDDNKQHVHAMISVGGEKLNFEQTVSIVNARGCVEKWLHDVEVEMQAAVKHEVTNSYADFVTTPRKDWILNWPQMVVLTISQIFWTSDLHSCLTNNNRELLDTIYLDVLSDLEELIAMMCSPEITTLNRLTLKSLCILEVHVRDVIQRLQRNRCAGVEDFEWLAHMRYYWIDGEVNVRLLNSTRLYFGNEYLGNFQRIVVTPLTERCYRTIICALEHYSFAALHGPSGTGKSETFKDMARALAIQSKVFNSLSDLDHTAIAKYLKGIVASGAWVCFEDINRIDHHTLSVIGQYIRSIILALRTSSPTLNFQGPQLNMKRSCFLCVTLNPNYVARTELWVSHFSVTPDNLKVLFRPVAMMKPEFAIIAQVTLYAGGFENAHLLATKIVSTFQICAELLPSEHFYDFGLRNMKSVLRSSFQKKYDTEAESTDEALIYRSLVAVIEPALRPRDVRIFNEIINDLFSSIDAKTSDDCGLRSLFAEVCRDEKLQPIERMYKKLVEARDSLRTKHALMLIGAPYTGKSSILKMLAKALAREVPNDNSEMKIEYINAKSVTATQLFGTYHSTNMEWTDGLVSHTFRQFFSATSNKCHKWIVLDGPIDAEWIENLNTVLDDDRKMCLSSGEVIRLTPNTSVLFEVDAVTHASPATISRIRIIHLADDTLGWNALARTWIEKCNLKWTTDYKQTVLDMFDWILPPVLNFVMRECKHTLVPLECNLANSMFNIFQMAMDDAIETNADDYQKFLMSWIQAAAIFGVVWGIGGLLDEQSRETFDRFHRKIWTLSEDHPPPQHLKHRLDITLPAEGNLADYFYVFKQKGAWKSWADFVRRLEPEVSHLGIQVATVDTTRFSHLLELHIKYNKQLLLVGPTGTGKSSIVQNILHNKLSAAAYVLTPIKFTISSESSETHEQIFSNLVKLKRNVYGPPKGRRCIMHVDDLNLPHQQPYGSHSSAELLRQVYDYRFVYDLKSPRKITLQNILTVATCGIPGGSWHAINSRVLCHFNCLAIGEYSTETMSRIFSAVLMIGLKRGGHATDVIGNVNQIITATLNVYHAIIVKLKPTPTKCHYAFNMRDVMRICNGCAMLRKESVENKKMFARIWFHEALRVFHDRLVDECERDFVFDQLTEQIEETFKDTMDQVFENFVEEDGTVTRAKFSRLVFGCYGDKDNEGDANQRRYEELPSFEKLVEIARASLDEFNAEAKNGLSVILFPYAIEHLNRICRIISTPGANGLIIGMGDSGRRSLVQLAAFMCKQNLFQMKIARNYDMHMWRADVKNVLKSAGGLGVPTIFLLSETRLTNQLFLTDVDHLLNSADIPNLWPIDEQQELLGTVRLAAQGGNRNIDVSPAEVLSFFVNRCRQNLHIVLCFSPVGNILRTQMRLFPSLANCCTIDWFDSWPDDALEIVASKYIDDVELPDDLRMPILSTCRYFHASAHEANARYCQEVGGQTYVTTSAFLELVRCFVRLFGEKQTEIMAAKSKFVSGLNTLRKAAEAVEQMQFELNELQPRLLAMAENSNEMMVEIESKTLEASVASEQVKRDEVIANGQAAAAEAMEDECSKDLAQAVPVLEDALQALNTLKPSDITLVKSMKNPPSAVKLVMAAVCVMKAVPPDRINDAASGKKIIDYWGPSKRILGDMGFLQSLKDYDKDDINPDIMKKIRKDFIPHKDFQPHVVAKASSAAEGLCKWIKAIENFESVNTVVRPKKMKLAKSKELLKETRKFLAEKRALAAELEAKVVGLNEELEKTNREKERTAVEVEICERKLERAETLINSLGEEKNRWTEAAATLQNHIDHLVGDILIACGFIAYLGPFSGAHRRFTIAQWHAHCMQSSIPCSNEFSLRSILGNEGDIQTWCIDCLPRDDYSIENVLIMRYSWRRCLFVDPQRQANKWIRRAESTNHLKVVKLSQNDYFRVLNDCLDTSTPILIEDIGDTLDSVLDPILCRRNDGNGFRLYMTCNRRHPSYSPEICNKINIVNFMLVSISLKEKLLDIVVAKENPYLREERDQLLVDKMKDSAELIRHEEDILLAIGESSDDILEDAAAIQKMDESKRMCRSIVDRQKTYVTAEEKINAFRDSYKRVAERSTIIYSCLNELPSIDPMYQFSLDWFINLFNHSIENASRSLDFERRISYLIASVTRNLYNNVCRSIFERDKLLFSWILTTKLMIATGRLENDCLRHFIGCEDDQVCDSPSENPDDTWLTDNMWIEVNKLAKFPSFSDEFIESFRKNLKDWREFVKTETNAIDAIPAPWHSKCSRFEKLLLLKIFHREQLAAAIVDFIANEMGAEYVNAPHFDIRKSFEQSNILTPILFILPAGIDPMETLLSFAQLLGYAQSFQAIAMGPDQQAKAEKYIEEAQSQGAWICLQNCHMSIDWLSQLEMIWEKISIYNTTSSFRLWLTTSSTPQFPRNLLQNGIKLVYEQPRGFQNNLRHSYKTHPIGLDTFYDGCAGKDKSFQRLIYSLCFFDAIVQERRHYGSIGWNARYNFTERDLQLSLLQLQQCINKSAHTPYAMLQYLVGDCNYGGHVTEENDQQLLRTILSDFINADVVDNPLHKFGPDDAYILPRRLEYREIVRYIDHAIPSEPSSELFGLDSNAYFTRHVATSHKLLESMSIAANMTRAPCLSRSETELCLRLNEIFAMMPEPIQLDQDSNQESNESIRRVLYREICAYNKLIEMINADCTHVVQAIEGSRVLTDELETIAMAILMNKVPIQWQDDDTQLATYLNEFKLGFEWFSRHDDQLPKTYWLGAFFYKRAFLTAIKLSHSRQMKMNVYDVVFDFCVTDKTNLTQPTAGFLIDRLYLVSAHWNGTHIEPSLKHVTKELMPPVRFLPIARNCFQSGERVECPLYRTSERRGIVNTSGLSSNFLMQLWLPLNIQNGKSQSAWRKRSVAVF